MNSENIKNFFTGKIERIILLIAAFTLLTLIGFQYQDKSLYIHFVDEEDNMILGKFVNQNFSLYKDLFSHHQPLTYILSAKIQQIIKPNSIYLLVKKHREVMIVWSIVWGVILVARFGLPLLGALLVYEITKFYLLGNQFLSESLVIYPLFFLITSFLLGAKGKIETFLYGFFTGFCAFLLSPLWPLLLILIIFKLLGLKDIKKNFLLIGLGILVNSILILPFISLSDYLYSGFYLNLFFYIPITSTGSFFNNLFNGFLSPIISFVITPHEYPLIFYIRLFSVAFIVNLIILISRKKYSIAITLFFLLGMSNLRYIDPSYQYFRGFHMLPWYGLLILLTFLSSFKVLEQVKGKKIYAFFGLSLIFLIYIIYANSADSVFSKRDLQKDYFVNYSRQFNIGEAIRILKENDSTLFVAPDDSLVYWQSQAKPASRLIYYYAWMNKVPLLKEEAINALKNKPDFVYLNEKGTGFEEYLVGYFNLKKDGRQTDLYVKTNILDNLGEENSKQLKFHNFEI